jgi:Class II Aldolase and Adducin N-terminal domain
LVALFGWDDLVFTHISARLPNTDHQFLLNPYGMMFEEVSASSLVKVDLEGHKAVPSETLSSLLSARKIAQPGDRRCRPGIDRRTKHRPGARRRDHSLEPIWRWGGGARYVAVVRLRW